GMGGPGVRLGFRQIKGFRDEHAKTIASARREAGHFDSIEQFHRRTHLPVRAIKLLAEADAFTSLGLSRRESLWQVIKLKDEDSPLFDPTNTSSPRLSIS